MDEKNIFLELSAILEDFSYCLYMQVMELDVCYMTNLKYLGPCICIEEPLTDCLQNLHVLCCGCLSV